MTNQGRSSRGPKDGTKPRDQEEETLLDLTSEETLFELAVEPGELLGRVGAKLIAEMKERAADAMFTRFRYRDPIRPGIIWLVSLSSEQGLLLPVRDGFAECRRTAEKVFPGFLRELEAKIAIAGKDSKTGSVDQLIMAQIPPIVQGVSGIELATALEYLIYTYPMMVRAWAALVFAYGEIMGLKEGSDTVREECVATCAYPQIVSYFLEGTA